MKLYRWQGAARNFGDELNTLLWPRLLPGFFDDNPAELFLGIGSVLDSRHPPQAVKLVAGAGYGGYQPPAALDANWAIHWTRGPRTAIRLGLPAAYGIGDPAMLIPLTGYTRAAKGQAVGFIPHFESAVRGDWAAVTEAVGIDLIDPRNDPDAIIAAIGRCRVVISEALHGAIVADALRVPWVALRPLVPVHRAKWHDWADTLNLRIEFHRLAASSLSEWLRGSRLAALHCGRRLLGASEPLLRRLARRRFLARSAQALAEAAAAPPQLSTAAALDRCQTRMLDRLVLVRRDPLRATSRVAPA